MDPTDIITPVTEYGPLGILGVLMLFAGWWMVYVWKPEYQRQVAERIEAEKLRVAQEQKESDRRIAQEEKESERRIIREDRLAEKQSEMLDAVSETLPALHTLLTEVHHANNTNHQHTHDKLDKIAQRFKSENI